jgi:hypothetical protein
MSLPPDVSQIPPLPSLQRPQVSAPRFPPPPFPPPRHLTGELQLPPDSVSIDSVRAALEKLDINMPVEDVLAAIREEEARRIADRQEKLSECKSLLLLICSFSIYLLF